VGVLRSLKTAFVELVHCLSEVEARLAALHGRLFLRRFYLRLCKVRFGQHLWVGQRLYLRRGWHLVLGERCALGSFVRITAFADIVIGDDFLAADGLTLISGTHDPLTLAPTAEAIHIGNRVWCGTNVTIIAGVTIGDDVVIGAGAVVVCDAPSNSIIAGVPAKVVKVLGRDPNTRLWTWVHGDQD
jgi:acetyltransferase-like isoleucine patch superfamily enzyme